MKFTNVVSTTKKSAGTNSCEFIVLHHTGGGSYQSNLTLLSTGTTQVSCHYVVGRNGEVGKIGNDIDILRHAGTSEWGNKKNLNSFSIGIEIVDAPSGERFTSKQREKVRELVEYLMLLYKIPNDNILTHASITWAGSKDKRLWDGVSSARKIDPDRSLWSLDGFSTFDEYRKSFGNTEPLLTLEQNRLFSQAMRANSEAWQVGDEQDRAVLANTNKHFRDKYKIT